ncbi:MAG: hypothetical protein ACR2L6_10610 [Gemmatimonadaceae bacterium]
MFIELIDLLRCTRPHEDSWLVATFHEMRERDVMEGLLSCPVCAARYPVTNGVAWFDAEPGTAIDAPRAPEENGLRVAAYLNLIEPGIVVLGGAWAASAEAIAQLGSRVIALNSPELRASPGVSGVRSDGTVPLARECLDGVALDSSEPRLVESAVRALKNGARLLAPLEAAVPPGLVELARDEKWWVAVREGGSASAPVQIARR